MVESYVLAERIETKLNPVVSKSTVEGGLVFVPESKLPEYQGDTAANFFNRGHIHGLSVDDFCNNGQIIQIIASPDLVSDVYASISERISSAIPRNLTPGDVNKMVVHKIIEEIAKAREYTGRLFIFRLSDETHPHVRRSVMFMSSPNLPLETDEGGKLHTYNGKLFPETVFKGGENLGVVPAYNMLTTGIKGSSTFKELGLVTVHGASFERDSSTGFLYSSLALHKERS